MTLEHGTHSRGHRPSRPYEPGPWEETLETFMAAQHDRYTTDDPATVDHPRPGLHLPDSWWSSIETVELAVCALMLAAMVVSVTIAIWVIW